MTKLKPFKFPSDLCKPRVSISMGLKVIPLWMKLFLLKVSLKHVPRIMKLRIKSKKNILLVGRSWWNFYCSRTKVWKLFTSNFSTLGRLEVCFSYFFFVCVCFPPKFGASVWRPGMSSLQSASTSFTNRFPDQWRP